MCVFLFQVTYTDLHAQSAWATDPHSGFVNYSGSLPHLRPGIAAPSQTFSSTSPGVPVPRPPATVRGRPLSAGARNRQLRDRSATEANMPNVRYGERIFCMSSEFSVSLRAGCSKHRLELTTRLTRGISPVNSWHVVPCQNPRVKTLARLTRELKLTSG